jgi:hypothetical protein
MDKYVVKIVKTGGIYGCMGILGEARKQNTRPYTVVATKDTWLAALTRE